MNSYIQIKKLHSDKKNSDYLSSVMYVYGKPFFVNLTHECIMMLLDLKPSEVNNLQVGFESEQIEIKLGK